MGYEYLGLSTWSIKYLHQALFISQWSKDPAIKVGCVISDMYGAPISQGINGFPQRIDDSPLILADKEAKRLRTIHAECNAILFSERSLEGTVLHTTHQPCASCAAMICQKRIVKVVFLSYGEEDGLSQYWDRSVKEGAQMFRETGVQVIEIPQPWLIKHTSVSGQILLQTPAS